MARASIYLACMLLPLFCSCKATKKIAPESKSAKEIEVEPYKGEELINYAGRDYVIEGTLLNKKTVGTEAGEGPCSIHPCLGVVRVDSILHMGQVPVEQLMSSTPADIFFRYTTEPHDPDLFPDKRTSLPGLKKGDKFRAIVKSSPASPKPRLEIFNYVKIN